MIFLFGCKESLPQQIFIEEFDAAKLDTTLWWTPPGTVRPTIENGHLVLISDSTKRTKSEVQSLLFFKYGEMKIVAYSSNWASNSEPGRTDTSIGWEFFGGNRFHHAILSTNGVLGVLHLDGNKELSCPTETTDQWYYDISSWDSIRRDTLTFYFIWKPDLISLFVYGKSDTGFAMDTTACHIPDTSLAIRLNCNVLLDDPGNLILAAFDTLLIDRIEVSTDMGVVVRHKDKKPIDFVFNQNFPNPFNPITTIEFNLPQDGYVTLKVYSILGRETSTLIDGVLQAGSHSVVFNGRSLASGIYFYRLQAGGLVQQRKMLLLR